MGAEIDSLEVKITSEAGTAEKAIDSLVKSLGKLAASLKFDTSSLEKLGNINGNNFKKLGEGLQSFSGAAKNLQNVNSRNFNKLANGIERIASIDSSKLEALGKIDGNSFRGLGEGVKALSSGLQNLQGVKKADFNRLATGIERLAAIQPGNMEAVGNVLRPLAEGINILSNAKFDNKNLTNLINSLTRLSNANTGSLANIDFSTLGNSIKGLSDTLSGAEKVQQNTISMTNAIAKLANSGENANIVSAALPQLGEKLKSFMQTMAGATQLESDTIAFTQALAQLANAGKRVESTASGLPKLGESLKSIFDIMSKMPSISENTIRMTQALAQLANAGGKAGNAAGNLNGRINTLSSSMLGLRGTTLKAVGGLKNFARQLFSSMGVYLGIYGAIRGAKKAIDISSDLTEVQNVVDVTFGDMAYKVEEFSQTSIEQFGMSELALKQYSSRFQAMGSAMGIDSSLIGSANDNLARMTDGYISASDSMADMSLNLTKLTADMASFYNVEQDVVAEKLASVFTGQTRPLRDFGLDLTQATLQEWALKQGMDVNIQAMSQAEKTMLRYQYVLANTTAAHGDFERTALTWANQVRILKQNFEQLAAVIGGTLVNAFKPIVIAINKAMSAIIAFAKTISNSLGQIFGWTFEEGGGGLTQDFSGAADAADDMAGSLGDAGKAIDKMKAGLRAFDELKVINMPDDKDGGAGAGGAGGLGGAGDALGGQWIEGESILKKYESELDTLYKLGEYIGKKLTEAMDSIDWNSVYEKARNFGKGLADFLNGLISPDLFGALGRTIAGALNTALYAALSFGETFDWKDFGLSIATGINNFFATYDFAALAQTLNVWTKGIWDTLKTAISNINWEDVWDGIKDFLNNIEFETVAIIIGALTIKKILGLHLASTALSFIGTTLSRKIAKAIAGKLGVEIAANVGIGKALATGLKAAFSSISGLNLFDIGTVLGAGTLAEKFAFISKMFGGISMIISGVVMAVKNFFDMWENGWNVVGEILKDIGIALAAIGAVILGVASAPAAIVAAIVAAVSSIVILIHDNWDAVSGFFSDLWDSIVNTWNTVAGWFNENVITPVVDFFTGLATRLQQIFEGLWIIIQAVWIVVSDWFNENVIVPVVNFFSPIVETVSNFFSEAWEKIKIVWSVVSGWFDTNIITPVSNAFYAACDAIGGFFSDLWNGIVQGVSGTMNAVITAIEGAINWIVDGLNGIISGFNKVVSWAAKITGSNWGGVDLIPSVSLGRINVSGYAAGGFPEDGWFRASHGEIMGQFDNGQSVVANNYQITEGIADAVYPAVYNAVSSAMRNNGGSGGDITIQVNLDGDVVYRNIIRRTQDQSGRTYGGRLVLADEVF